MIAELLRMSLLLVWPAAVGVTPDECPSLETAHERFLAGSFALERNLRLSVSGTLKRREVPD